eukprot:TRINITY_DN2328_c0_g1_i1.p1 TRINITY_DN2328_c0_g1~~TRINITY_DN2328_c0_g1_i1.p1  ORF type:complete len:569 (-),score=169.35 TRINITY_DN2328_c0_g1_i1:56-1711(-)
MNVIAAVQDYVTRMVSSVPGMKVLMLDHETTSIVGMVYSQSVILQREVYLFTKLEATNRELMPHLKAVCLLRGTQTNLRLLQEELRDPKYGEYYLFFTTMVKSGMLDEIAQSDEHEVVQTVHEFYADYYAVNTDLFSLGIDAPLMSVQEPDFLIQTDRIVDGVCGVLLSLRRRPFIRYQKGSEVAQRVTQEIVRRMQQESDLFDFRRSEIPPLLIVLDRKDDPVTPLLLQWTYQAMVHELIGIKNNLVNMGHVPGVKEDMKEIVLSPDQDAFYRDNMFQNYGDLGSSIKDLVDEFQQKSKSNQSIQSLEDIKKFVESYPQFRAMSGNVSKHVTIMGELSRQAESRRLLDVSELEQDLACKHDPSSAFRRLMDFLNDPSLHKKDKLRLVLLYCLRYEDNGKLQEIQQTLAGLNFPQDDIDLIGKLLRYAGQRARSVDLFGNKSSIWERTRNSVKRQLKGVPNIYTQHQPFLYEILDSLLKGRMRDADYPFMFGNPFKERLVDIIVCIVGGATYEEAFAISELNKANPSSRIILGGTAMLNSTSFIRNLQGHN